MERTVVHLMWQVIVYEWIFDKDLLLFFIKSQCREGTLVTNNKKEEPLSGGSLVTHH